MLSWLFVSHVVVFSRSLCSCFRESRTVWVRVVVFSCVRVRRTVVRVAVFRFCATFLRPPRNRLRGSILKERQWRDTSPDQSRRGICPDHDWRDARVDHYMNGLFRERGSDIFRLFSHMIYYGSM